MHKSEIVKALAAAKVVPVIRHRDAAIALKGARMLNEAGFLVLEITFTVPDAASVIDQICETLPGALVGAGTVLSEADARNAAASGAKFLVSPCWIDDVARVSTELNIAYLPGGATPGEILHNWRSGAAAVKIFPARETGGLGFLKAVRAVFPDIPFMPTGGVKPEEVADYLTAGAICVGLGSELFPAEMLESGADARAREVVRSARLAMSLEVSS